MFGQKTIDGMNELMGKCTQELNLEILFNWILKFSPINLIEIYLFRDGTRAVSEEKLL